MNSVQNYLTSGTIPYRCASTKSPALRRQKLLIVTSLRSTPWPFSFAFFSARYFFMNFTLVMTVLFGKFVSVLFLRG